MQHGDKIHGWVCVRVGWWIISHALVTSNTGYIFIKSEHFTLNIYKLEDPKVLKRSPDLLNNVKIGQGLLSLIIETYFVLPYMEVAAILVK